MFRHRVAAPPRFIADGAAHDVAQGVTQVVAGVMAAQFDGHVGDAVEAEVGELEIDHMAIPVSS